MGDWIDDDAKKISITMPKPEIDDPTIDANSFKVYHEAESAFRKITLSEINEKEKELTDTALREAILNGMIDRAKNNAKQLLVQFVGKDRDIGDYKIEYHELKGEKQ